MVKAELYVGAILWRWRGAAVWRTAVPHGKSAIGPSLFAYSGNGEDVLFPKAMGPDYPGFWWSEVRPIGLIFFGFGFWG